MNYQKAHHFDIIFRRLLCLFFYFAIFSEDIEQSFQKGLYKVVYAASVFCLNVSVQSQLGKKIEKYFCSSKRE